MNEDGTRQSLVVVALDVVAGKEYAIELARGLVQTEAPELLGLFVENADLLEYARSRRAREILVTGRERALDREALERQLRSQAARARARFEAATSRLGLRHRFEVIRGDVFGEPIRRAAAAAALVVGLARVAAGGHIWTHRLARELIEARVPRVLLAREGWLTGRSIAVVVEDIVASSYMLEAAARIAKQSRSSMTVLTPAGGDREPSELARQIEDALGPHGIEESGVILLRERSVSGIVQATRACQARLLVMPSPTEPEDSASLDELLRRFPGALMLVRP